MFDSYKLKQWLSWPLVRAHLCTFAVAVSFNSTWRTPRDAFRFGGLTYGLVLTVAMATVALPLVLMQLAIGQLSQQDAVGVWRAVPFFRGVGYLRLLVSLLSSVYSSIYLALTITYFLYTLSNSIPFRDCMEMIVTPEGYENSMDAPQCLNETFMSPIKDKPEYYLAVSLIVLVLWIVFPFLFYNPVKLMKRIFYIAGPLVVLLGIVILSAIGDMTNIESFTSRSDWKNFVRPDIWQGALVQALLSSQVAGGYLISAGDSVYASTNVEWTAMAFVGANVLSSWAGLIFWFSVSGPGERDTSMVAVLVQVYRTADENGLSVAWPLVMFAMLLLSGVITMLTLLYPIYDRLRRIGGIRWRVISISGSIVGAGATLAALAGRLPALALVEDITVPFLTSVATVLEILAFVFIYGWKVLVEDVEFLTGRELPKWWVWGWCAAPGIITPFFVWWLTTIFMRGTGWTEPPWPASTIAATALLAGVILAVFASVSVGRQVQYDIFGKLKSSFTPSRHWGPRDPITHYYWLARREEADRGNIPRNRYYRRQLGQLSSRPSFLIVPNVPVTGIADVKRRSNSDDWLYTVYRKKYLSKVIHESANERKRSKSLDLTAGIFDQRIRFTQDSIVLKEHNNNVLGKYSGVTE